MPSQYFGGNDLKAIGAISAIMITLIGGITAFSGSFQNLDSQYATSTHEVVGELQVTSSARLPIDSQVNAKQICLADGTNCPASTSGTGTDLNWTFDETNNLVRNATPTTDIVLGSDATSTGAPVYFDLTGEETGTSTVVFGYNTNTRVGIGVESPSKALDVKGDIENIYQQDQMLSLRTDFDISNIIYSKKMRIQGRFLYLLATTTLTIVDFTNVDAPIVVSQTEIKNDATSIPQHLAVSGRYVYTVDTDGFMNVVDVSVPSAPVIVGTLTLSPTTGPEDIVVQGSFAYVLGGDGNLYTIDIHDPTNPVTTSIAAGGGGLGGMAIQGHYIYTVDQSFALIIPYDITDPANPVAGTYVASPGAPSLISIEGNYAYVMAEGSGDLDVFDLSDPMIPVLVKEQHIVSPASELAVDMALTGRYIYLSTYGVGHVMTVDVKDPLAPSIVSTTTLSGEVLRTIATDGKYVMAMEDNSVSPLTLHIFEAPGVEAASMLVHSAEVGDLHVLQGASIYNWLTVGGGLNVGSGGILSFGAINVGSTNTTSTFAYAVSTTQAEVSKSLTVGGVNVCLQDGTNCPGGGGGGGTQSLAQTTAYGATTTDTLELYGGFLAASSTVTSTLTVVGDFEVQGVSSLQNMSFVDGTSSNWFGFTSASGSTLDASAIQVNGIPVCLQDGTNCPGGGGGGTQSLAQTTFYGATTTDLLSLYGGFLAASSTVTSTFTTVGLETNVAGFISRSSSTIVGDLSLTGTLYGVDINGNDLFAGNDLHVNGAGDVGGSLTAGAGMYITGDLQASGGTTTISEPFEVLAHLSTLGGGFISQASSTVVGAMTVTGATSLQGLSFVNGTSSAWLGFATASGTTLNASAINVNGSAVCLANGTNCPVAGTQSLAQTTAIGAVTSDKVSLFGGFLSASSTVTSTLTTVGLETNVAGFVSQASSTVVGALTVTGATSFQGLSFVNGTSSVWLGFTTASGTTLHAGAIDVNGSAVCLANGTNCPAGGSQTLAQTTALGAVTNDKVSLFGGFLAASSTVTSTLTTVGLETNVAGFISQASSTIVGAFTDTGAASFGSTLAVTGISTLTGGYIAQASSTVVGALTVTGATSLQGLSFVNGTSSAWLGFATASGTTLNAGAINVNGSAVCLANGTNCPVAGTQSLAQTTAIGAVTNDKVSLFGGFLAASSTVTSTLTIVGLETDIAGFVSQASSTVVGLFTTTGGYISQASSTVVGAFTSTGATTHGSTLAVTGLSTLTGGFVSQASSTVVGAFTDTGATVLGSTLSVASLATLTSGYVSQSSSTVVGAFTVTGAGSFGSTLAVTGISTLTGGFVAQASSTIVGALTDTGLFTAAGGYVSQASSTVVGAFTVTGATTLATMIATNATTTNATTTSLYVSGTASTSVLYVNGQLPCLANGVNCPLEQWNVILNTGTTTASINQGYISTSSSIVTLTLPATAAVGSVIDMVGQGSGGWKIGLPASTVIHFGNLDTTTGVSGYISSLNRYDGVRLVNVVANTEWVVVNAQGTMTVN